MGRGRAKAKQTKVARELKYSSHPTDLAALQRELGGSQETTETSPDGQEDRSADHERYEGYDGYDPDDWARASR
jgi:hypothetical protein